MSGETAQDEPIQNPEQSYKVFIQLLDIVFVQLYERFNTAIYSYSRKCKYLHCCHCCQMLLFKKMMYVQYVTSISWMLLTARELSEFHVRHLIILDDPRKNGTRSDKDENDDGHHSTLDPVLFH